METIWLIFLLYVAGGLFFGGLYLGLTPEPEDDVGTKGCFTLFLTVTWPILVPWVILMAIRLAIELVKEAWHRTPPSK